MNRNVCALTWVALVGLLAAPMPAAAAVSIGADDYQTINRQSNYNLPKSTSGITYVGGANKDFYAVADDATTAYELGLHKFVFQFSEREGDHGTYYKVFHRQPGTAAQLSAGYKALANTYDLEAVAYDPGSGNVWVANEAAKANVTAANVIREYNPASGAVVRTLTVPSVYASARGNLGFESLTISGDGLTLWTCNEEALTVDGPKSSATTPTTVRISKFTRARTCDTFTFVAMYPYTVPKWASAEGGMSASSRRGGVADLCALPDGTLLVLERELSNDTFRNRICKADFTSATDVSSFARLDNTTWTAATRTVLKSFTSGGSMQNLLNKNTYNFEGLCLGPREPQGSTLLLLIADAGDGLTSPSLRAEHLYGLDICTLDFGAPPSGMTAKYKGTNFRFVAGRPITVTVENVGSANLKWKLPAHNLSGYVVNGSFTFTPTRDDTLSYETVSGTVHTHSWGSGTVTTAATCATPGVMTYTCGCGETRTEAIPATGNHDYEDGSCTVCGGADPDYVPPSTQKGFARAAEESRPPRVLVIGNSFTQGVSRDVQRKADGTVKETRTHFPTAVRAMGRTIDYCALYRGGCSIQQHYEGRATRGFCSEIDWSFDSAAPGWASTKDGQLWLDEDGQTRDNRLSETLQGATAAVRATTPADTSLEDILAAVDWDVVMIQEASVLAPFLNAPESEWTGVHAAEPYRDYETGTARVSYGEPLQNFVAYLRAHAPHAELWWHQTWALHPETTSIDLGSDAMRDWMYDELNRNAAWVAETYDLQIMPTGYAVQLYRYRLPVTQRSQDPCSFDARHINGGYGIYDANPIPAEQRYRTYMQMMTWCQRFFGAMPAAGATPYEPSVASEKTLMRTCAQLAAAATDYSDYGQGTAPAEPEPATKTTYYLKGTDGSGASSFVSSAAGASAGWATAEGGAVVAHTVAAGNDYVIPNGAVMRTPQSVTSVAFKGDTLTLAGGLLLKSATSVTIPSLVGAGGEMNMGDKNKSVTFAGAISIPLGQKLKFGLFRSDSTSATVTTLNAALTGAGTLQLQDGSVTAASSVQQTLVVADAAGFTGALASSALPHAQNFVLKVTGGFGGSVASLPLGTTKVVFNYAGLDAATGVAVSSATVPEGLTTGLVLYGVANTSAADLPLMTFPVGTTLAPSAFTVKHASSVDGAGTAFARLGTRTNVDGTVTLVANASGGSSDQPTTPEQHETWRAPSFDAAHTIVCYGDSLTFGRNSDTTTVGAMPNYFDGRLDGLSGVEKSYPYFLSQRVPTTYNVIAQALSGMYTDLILAWQGATAVKTAQAFTLPASGAVTVDGLFLFDGTGTGDIVRDTPSLADQYAGLVAPRYALHESVAETVTDGIKTSISGCLGGIHVRITGMNSSQLKVRATPELSSAWTVPAGTAFVPDATRAPYRDAVQVIFAGTNDGASHYQDYIARIQAAVAQIPSGRYVVVSSHRNMKLSGETDAQTTANAVEQAFAAAFGAHHLNLRLALYAKDANWETDGKLDTSDNLHFKAAGYDLVSEIVHEKLQALGYVTSGTTEPDDPPDDPTPDDPTPDDPPAEDPDIPDAPTYDATKTAYYLVGQDGSSATSFTSSKSGDASGWATALNGTVGAHTVGSGKNYFVSTYNAGKSYAVLRLPSAVQNPTFAGDALMLDHGDMDGSAYHGGMLTLKTTSAAGDHTITIPHFEIDGGTIFQGDTGKYARNYVFAGSSMVVKGAGLHCLLYRSDDTQSIGYKFAAPLWGSGPITFGQVNGMTGTYALEISDAAYYTGALKSSADATVCLMLTGGFGGSVESLSANTTRIALNYDANPKGLVCSATTVPTKLQTTLVVYSTVRDLDDMSASPNLTLITFTNLSDPTALDPDDFTVEYSNHAVTPNEGCMPFTEELYVRVNADGSRSVCVNQAADTRIAKPAAPAARTYNGEEQEIFAGVAGYVVTGGRATDAGTYAYSVTPAAGYAWTDGTKTAVTGSWTITPLTAVLDNWTTAFTYDGQAHTPTCGVGNLKSQGGVLDPCTVTVEGGQTDAGTYTATATALSNPNYALPTDGSASRTFTIRYGTGYTITVAGGDGGTPGSAPTYDAQGGEQTVTITLPAKTGYSIASWACSKSGVSISGATVTIPAKTFGNFTLTPTWTPMTYTVNTGRTELYGILKIDNEQVGFSGRTGDQHTGTFDRGLELAWSASTPGWTYAFQYVNVYSGTDATGTLLATYTSGKSATFTMQDAYYENIYVELSYTRTADTYTIALHDGVCGDSTFTIDYSATTPKLTPPSKAGYRFLGYGYLSGGTFTRYFDADGNPCQSVVNPKWTLIGDSNLYAGWVKQVTVPTGAAGLVYAGSSQTGVVGTDEYSVTDGSGTDAGGYTATVALTQPTPVQGGVHSLEWKLANGTTSTEDQSVGWTIAKKGVTVDWRCTDGTVSGTAWRFDNKAHAPTPALASGSLCGSDTCDITTTVSAKSGSALTDGAAREHGSYTATALLGNANYAISSGATQDFSIDGNYTITVVRRAPDSGADIPVAYVAKTTRQEIDVSGLPTFNNKGYIFGGWDDPEDATKHYNTSGFTEDMFKLAGGSYGDFRVCRNYQAISYNIAYALDGGSIADSKPTSATFETLLAVPAPTKTGHAFAGWKVSGSALYGNMGKWGTTSSPATAVTTDSVCVNGDTGTVYFKNLVSNGFYNGGTVTLTATWKANTYTVTLNTDGGTGSALTGYTYGTGATLPTLTKTGYIFRGWFAHSDFSGSKVKTIGTTETGNKTFYARFVKKPVSFTFDAQGGAFATANDDARIVPYGDVMTHNANVYPGDDPDCFVAISTNITLSGNYFTVTVTSSSSHCWPGQKARPVDYIREGAHYTAVRDVDAVTGTATFQGSATEINSDASKSYQSQLGSWSISGAPSVGQTFAVLAGTVRNATTYPIPYFMRSYWHVSPNNAFTVRYRLAVFAGACVAAANYAWQEPYDGYIVCALPTVTRTGYTFGGWYTQPNGAGTQYTAESTATSDQTLYAKWTANGYTVTFNANGGMGTMAQMSWTYGTSKSLTANAFTNPGYRFTGWNTAANGSGTGYAAGADMKNVAGNTTLYAQWAVDAYGIGYDNLFIFAEWAKNRKSCNCDNNPSAEFAVDVNAGEVTIENTRTDGKEFVTGNANSYYCTTYYHMAVDAGETYVVSAQVDVQVAGTGSGDPAEMFVFFYDQNKAYNTNRARNKSLPSSGTLTFEFTPQSTEQWIDMRFDVNRPGGKVTFSNITIRKKSWSNGVAYSTPGWGKTLSASATTYGTLASPTKTGYTFDGWKDTAGTTITDATALDGSKTLVSQWTANGYTITYAGLKSGSTHANPTTYTIESDTITFTAASDTSDYKFRAWSPASLAKGSTGDRTVTASYYTKVAKPTAPADFTYDGTQKTAAADNAGYALADHKKTDAGDYTFTATLKDGYCWSDGTFDVVSVGWKIKPATAVLNNWTTTFTYDGQSHVPACGVNNLKSPGGVKDTCTVTVSGGQTEAGTYTATATALSNPNYALPTDGSQSVEFTINKASIDVSGVGFADKTVTYDGTAQSITYTGTLPSKVSSATVSYKNATTGAAVASPTGAGTYTATLTFAVSDSKNYNVPTAKPATLTITRADIELPSQKTALTYDGTQQTVTLTHATGYTITGNTGTNAGGYTATLTPDGNHKWSSDGSTAARDVTWTIAKKGVTVDWRWTGGTVSGTAWRFDNAAHAPTPALASGSLCGSDTCDITTTVSATSGSALTGGEAREHGSYTATASLGNANYAISTGSAQDFSIDGRYTITVVRRTPDSGDDIQVPYVAATTQQLVKVSGLTAFGYDSGYIFSGWDDVNDPTKHYNTSGYTETSFKIRNGSTYGDFSVFRKYQAISCNIGYDLAGGTAGSTMPTSGDFETVFAVPAPTRTGYTFAGWKASGDALSSDKARWGMTSDPSTQLTPASVCVNGPAGTVYFKNLISSVYVQGGTVTLTAQWTATGYTITYAGLKSGSTHANPTTYTIESDDITFAAASDTSDYKFRTWSPAALAKGSTGDRTVTASYYTKVAKPTAPADFTYDGVEKTAAADNAGYALADHKKTDAGDYTFTATLKDGYCWSDGTFDDVSVGWKIKPAKLTNVSVSGGAYAYTGSPIAVPTGTPSATSVNGQTVTFKYSATEGGAYSTDKLQYTAAGTYDCYYQISAPNHDTVSGKVTLTINPRAITGVEIAETSLAYTGAAQRPTVVRVVTTDEMSFDDPSVGWNVTYARDGKTFVAAEDFDFVSPGTISVAVTGQENLTDSAVATYEIGTAYQIDGIVTGARIKIDKTWAEAFGKGKTTDEVRTELSQPNANGVTGWQAYVLGFTPEQAKAAAVKTDLVLTEAGQVRLSLADWPESPATDSGVKVTYVLKGCSDLNGGFETEKSSDSPQFDVDLTQSPSGERRHFYRISTEFANP